VRLWDREKGKILQEAAPHKSHVNSIRFDAKGERLYSGDGAGSVAIWSCYDSGNEENPLVLQCLKVVSLFGGAPINSIQVFSRSFPFLLPLSPPLFGRRTRIGSDLVLVRFEQRGKPARASVLERGFFVPKLLVSLFQHCISHAKWFNISYLALTHHITQPIFLSSPPSFSSFLLFPVHSPSLPCVYNLKCHLMIYPRN
jgi:hypothetical protein